MCCEKNAYWSQKDASYVKIFLRKFDHENYAILYCILF